MINSEGPIPPEPDIARSALRRYYRNEVKYDSWGAQGKILAVQEALEDADVSPRDLTPWHIHMERIVNEIFPRTFLFQWASVSPMLTLAVRMHSANLSRELSDFVADARKRYGVICEEAAARFSLPADQVDEILAGPQQSNEGNGVTFL